MVELSALVELVVDPEAGRGLHFPLQPRIGNPLLAARFSRLHRALERPAPALEREVVLGEWLLELFGPPLAGRETVSRAVPARALRDPALRRARELLEDESAADLTLEQLALAAGSSRHRLTRLFRLAYGVPPHRYQVARRLSRARALLERGIPIAAAATLAGFFDQSHLHRHFRRAFGFTPARYVALLRSGVQDGRQLRDPDSPLEVVS